MKIKSLFVPILLLAGLTACIEETIQMDRLSTEVEVERSISIPLVKATLVFDDFAAGDFDIEVIGDDTVRLWLPSDFTLEDTLQFGGLGQNMIFDYIYLHHSSRNMLPVGLRLNLYLYDEVLQSNIDTISFSDVPGGEFIKAPNLYPNGLVIEEEIETVFGRLDLDNTTLNNLFENSTHIILAAEAPETDSVVKILDYYSLELDLGLSARGRFQMDLDSTINNLDSAFKNLTNLTISE